MKGTIIVNRTASLRVFAVLRRKSYFSLADLHTLPERLCILSQR